MTRPIVHEVSYVRQVQDAVTQYCDTVTSFAQGSHYIKVLRANTNRLQGSLVLVGYEICGGKDEKMIIRAALAIELCRAYVKCLEQGIDVTQALRAQHEAAIIMATLEADPEYRIKALGITNRTLMLANLAQLDTTSQEDRLQWRATELALNPLHVGQVLAGSDCDANNAVTPLATRIGMQLVDDKAGIDVPKFFSQLRAITW